MSLLEQFLFTGFESGDYTYGVVHIGSIVLMLASIPVLVWYYRKQDLTKVRNHMRIVAGITLAVYLLRRGIDVYQGRPFLETFWPFYLCNVNTVILSLLLLFDIKRGRDFFLITGMSGAILMFVVPEGVFNDRFLTLQIFESLLSHYFIFMVPIVFMATKYHTLQYKHSWQSLIGFGLVLMNVELLQEPLTGRQVDYLFLRGPIDLTWFGLPQVVVMFGLAILYVYAIITLNQLLIGRFSYAKEVVLEPSIEG